MYRIGQEQRYAVGPVIAGERLFRSGDAAKGHQHAAEGFERRWPETIGSGYALCLHLTTSTAPWREISPASLPPAHRRERLARAYLALRWWC